MKRPALNRDNVALGNLIFTCTYGIALSGPRDKSDRNLILGARMTQCTTLWDKASHSRESFYECFGHEGEENPVRALSYEKGTLSVRTRDDKTYEIRAERGACVLDFFKKINMID